MSVSSGNRVLPMAQGGEGERKGRAGKGVGQHRVRVVGAACRAAVWRAVGDARLLQELLLQCFVSENGFSAFVTGGALMSRSTGWL